MLIEGSFRELVEEISDYIDNIKSAQDATSSVRSDIGPALDTLSKAEESGDGEAAEKARDEVLKVLVPKTDALNNAPEKGSLCIDVSNFARSMLTKSRVHCRLQPACPPRRAVLEHQQLPADDMPQPLR